MQTFIKNGITINCLFTDLSVEQKQDAEYIRKGIQRYKDLQVKAVQDYFSKDENIKLFSGANIASVDVDARIQYVIKSEKFPKGLHPRDLIILPMGLAIYEPLLKNVQRESVDKVSSDRHDAIKQMRKKIVGQKIATAATTVAKKNLSKKNKTLTKT